MAHTSIPTELQIVQLPIDNLHPDPANPRRISDSEFDILTRSLRECGFVQPVIARHDDHIVIGAHQRLVAARRLGLKTVPVIFVDLSAEQSHLLILALNRIRGDWYEQFLARMLTDLQAAECVDLTLSGFEDDEVKRLLRELDAEDKLHKAESPDLDASWEKRKLRLSPSPGTSGSRASTASSVATQRTPMTWRGSWTRNSRRCSPATRPTSWTTRAGRSVRVRSFCLV